MGFLLNDTLRSYKTHQDESNKNLYQKRLSGFEMLQKTG